MQPPSTKNSIFLLGGHDLEMQKIKEFLQTQGFKKNKNLYDRNLSWGASLSAYNDIIEQHKDKTIYGIELTQDCTPPPNYHAIDHHNERYYYQASLLQVLTLFGKEPDRDQQLVAANDSGYINGMKSLEPSATKSEIHSIRQRDRKAQGLTDKDYDDAKEDVQKILETLKTDKTDIAVVRSSTPHFSAVLDALYFEVNKDDRKSKAIIYNDNEIVFYGFDLSILISTLKQHGLGESDYYYGSGFLGIKPEAQEKYTIQKLKEDIMKHDKKISSHIFMFPFRFDLVENGLIKDDKPIHEYDFYKNSSITERINIDKLHTMLTTDGWVYEPFVIAGIDRHKLYSDFGYFYDYARAALYNAAEFDPETISSFYRRKIGSDSTYTIDIPQKGKTYTLPIEGITLRIFHTGVGILSIELANYEYSELKDILNINDFGRRIYPQMIGVDGVGTTKSISLLPDAIRINLDMPGKTQKEQSVIEHFDQFHFRNIQIGEHVMFLLGRNTFFDDKCQSAGDHARRHNNKGKFYIQPSLDDRMFVLSWYGSQTFSSEIKAHNSYLCSNDWYQYVFVDNNGATVQNDTMREQLLRDATYARWSKYGTLFGITRYSLVALTDNDNFGRHVIGTHMTTMYFQMATMLLANRTSILRFSDEIAAIATLAKPEEEQRLSRLYAKYLDYYNRLYFKEVTHQDQGIEIYDIGIDQMKIAEHIAKLDNKFAKLHDFANLKAQDRESEAMNGLNVLAATLGVPALVMSVFSIGVFDYHKSFASLGWAMGAVILSGFVAFVGARTWVKHKAKGGTK